MPHDEDQFQPVGDAQQESFTATSDTSYDFGPAAVLITTLWSNGGRAAERHGVRPCCGPSVDHLPRATVQPVVDQQLRDTPLRGATQCDAPPSRLRLNERAIRRRYVSIWCS